MQQKIRKRFFGSRIPIFNFIFSKITIGAFFGRVKYLRIKNKIKEHWINKTVTLTNGPELVAEFQEYLDKGITKLNVGGGRYNLDGYVNIDFAKFPSVERGIVASILDLSFIPDNCLTHVYSNQVIEHLDEDQLLHQLEEYKRILKDDGIIIFRTPNILGVSYGFWFGHTIESGREEFIELGYPEDGLFNESADGWYYRDLYALVHWVYADAGNIKNQHLAIYTPTKIKNYLKNAGYELIKMTDPECSQITVIAKPIPVIDV